MMPFRIMTRFAGGQRVCRRFWRCPAAVVCLVLFLLTSPCRSATFVVGTVAELQAALDAAAANGENDVIEIEAGIYAVAASLVYSGAEDFSLTISGVSSSQTTLDGGLSVQIMQLTATYPQSHVVVAGIGFQNGRTSGDGGALTITTDAADIELRGCSFTANATTGGDSVGGGAVVLTDSGSIIVEDCVFSENHSTANVGGLYAATTNGVIRLLTCAFQDNSVDNVGSSPYYGDGGGAMLYTDTNGQTIATGNTFERNTTTGGDNPDGGGLMVYQLGVNVSADVQANTFDDNTAQLGAGGCIVRINGQGSMTVSNNQFLNNEATDDAGGGALLYLDSGTITCTGNEFSGNQAGGSGGGLWISLVDGTADISDNAFWANQAGGNGAGLDVFSEDGCVTLTGNRFAENVAVGVGGGLSYATTTGEAGLSHATFFDNAADDGGAVYAYFDDASATMALANSILWLDTPNEFATSHGGATSPTLGITYSDVDGLSGDPWFGTGCIDADPLFADAAHRDFHLTWANFPVPDATKSPCIDTGDPAAPLDPDGTRTDMGAFPYDQFVPGQPTFTHAFIFCRQETTSRPVTPVVVDPDLGDTHTFEVIADPPHGDVEPTPPADQLFLVPDPGFVGRETFSYRAIDPLGLSVGGVGEVVVEPHSFYLNLATWPTPNIPFFIPYIDDPNHTESGP